MVSSGVNAPSKQKQSGLHDKTTTGFHTN